VALTAPLPWRAARWSGLSHPLRRVEGAPERYMFRSLHAVQVHPHNCEQIAVLRNMNGQCGRQLLVVNPSMDLEEDFRMPIARQNGALIRSIAIRAIRKRDKAIRHGGIFITQYRRVCMPRARLCVCVCVCVCLCCRCCCENCITKASNPSVPLICWIIYDDPLRYILFLLLYPSPSPLSLSLSFSSEMSIAFPFVIAMFTLASRSGPNRN